ncbi:MAG: Ig-like domain-containing protein [Actinobacteria bacterium]|nr:Ig-like domain-containing protein [Actinomycetota bacterium]
MKANDIEPIVRLYRGSPNPGTLSASDLDAISNYVIASASYIESNNEPNLHNEWAGGTIPGCNGATSCSTAVCAVAAQTVMQNWVQDAANIQKKGAYPVFPALAPGGNCNDNQFLKDSFDYLKNNNCTLADGTNGNCLEIFNPTHSNNKPAVIGIHNYNLNHDNSKDLSGNIIWYNQDSNAFQQFTFYDSIIKSYAGKSIPMLATEGGLVIGDNNDNRYPATDAAWHKDVTTAMANYQMDNKYPYFLNTSFWLSTDPDIFANAAWFNADYSSKVTDTINALKALPKKSRNGSQPPAACTVVVPTVTPIPSVKCNTDVVLNVSSNNVNSGQPITFNISGDASLYVGDTWTPIGGTTNTGCDCITTADGGNSCGFAGSKTCTAGQAGSYTWTHYWKKCEGSFTNCSSQCSASVNFNVNSVATPTPTPTVIVPTATPTPVPPTPTLIVDKIVPIVNITYPYNGGTVVRARTINITASASDNVGVKKVEFYVNGALKCSDTVFSYSCSWLVPNKTGVAYTLTAKAYDAAGNNSSSTIKVKSR